MTDIIEAGWYKTLVDDLIAIHTEAVFNSRWELVIGYHTIGKRIVQETNFVWNARGNGETLSRLSKSTGIHERDLRRAIQFYKRYPDPDLLPDGKNISWNKIVNNLLPEHSGAPSTARSYLGYYAPRLQTLYTSLMAADDTPDSVRAWLADAPEEVKTEKGN